MLELHSIGAGFTPELPAIICSSYSILSWAYFWFGLGCLGFFGWGFGVRGGVSCLLLASLF